MLQCHMHKDDTEASQVNKRALTARALDGICDIIDDTSMSRSHCQLLGSPSNGGNPAASC
jgi:hypothetical protein